MKDSQYIDQMARSVGWNNLHCAVEKQNLHWAQVVVDMGYNVNDCDRFSRTPLSLAAAKGNIELTKWLLDAGTEINNGFPLHYATEKGHLEIVRYLIKNGADVNLAKDNNYPLIIAATNGHFEVAKVLIENGADTGVTDETNSTALHHACLSENLDLIALLIDSGCNIDAQDKYDTTPLSICLIHRENNPELVKLLLAKGASVNMPEVQNTGVLHSSGHPVSTLELIKYGADINVRDIRDETPLFCAAEMERTECAKVLLENNADPNIRASGGGSVLHLAVDNNDLELVKELLKRKACVNAANAQNVIPLHLAIQNGHSEIVEKLLEHGSLIDVPVIDLVDVNCCSRRYNISKGSTPRTMAELSEHDHIVQLLQKYSVSQTNNFENTPDCNYYVTFLCFNNNTFWFLGFQDLETIKKLNPNDPRLTAVTNLIGWTPLHHYVWSGCYDISSELVKKGAPVNVLDNYERTPLSLAAALNDVQTIKLLVDNGADVNLGLALHYGMDQNAVESLLQLIKYNCDINIKNKSLFESSVLVEAPSQHKSKIVKILLEHKADVNDVSKHEQTALHNACQFDDIESVRLLLEHGAAINAVDNCQDIPLICAAPNSSHELLKILIENGGDIHWKDNSRWTPLHRASSKDKSTLELLKAGADVNYYNDNVESPLYLATSNPKVMKILLDYNADVHFNAFGGWSILHESAFYGSLECVKLLLDKNINVNLGSAENVLPIYLASISGRCAIVEELLKHGAFVDPYILDIGVIRIEHIMFPMNKSHHIVPGNTPVIGAASKGHLEVVRLLHSYGADLDVANVEGNTALHEAVLGGFENIVEFLLSQDADVVAKNKKGQTALDLARENSNDLIVTLLVS